MNNPTVGGLEIIGIRDAGNIDKERLLLRAIEPVKAEYYLVVNVKRSGEKLTPLNDKVFWFPTKLINTGEFIRLYTKKGVNDKQESKFGEEPATYHNFYWDLDKAIWDGVQSDAVTIFKLDTWNTAYST
jgi:hypothetical protein